jgi:cation transport ATPase
MRMHRSHRLLPGLEIAHGSWRIALESVIAGIGLSVAGMIAAALGFLTPVQGALLQELIDVAVILNALRALKIAPSTENREALVRQDLEDGSLPSVTATTADGSG